MSKRIALDSNPLSTLCHPDPRDKRMQAIAKWLRAHLAAGAVIFIPEISDYEVRRELLRARKLRSVLRLNELRATLTYLPLNTPTMERAAEMWAEARQRGQATADPKEIDADVILAAQAEAVGAIIATNNVGHLARFVAAQHWQNIPVGP